MLALAHAACRQWHHCLPRCFRKYLVNSLQFLPGFLVALSFLLSLFFLFILSRSLVLLRLFPWSSSISLSHLLLQRPHLLPSLPWLRADKGPCLPAWLPELDLRGPTRCQGRTVPCKSSCELHNAPLREVNRTVIKHRLLSLPEEACPVSTLYAQAPFSFLPCWNPWLSPYCATWLSKYRIHSWTLAFPDVTSPCRTPILPLPRQA